MSLDNLPHWLWWDLVLGLGLLSGRRVSWWQHWLSYSFGSSWVWVTSSYPFSTWLMGTESGVACSAEWGRTKNLVVLWRELGSTEGKNGHMWREKPQIIRNRGVVGLRGWARSSWCLSVLMEGWMFKSWMSRSQFVMGFEIQQKIFYPYSLHLLHMMRNFPANRRPDNDKPNPH